jgi:serine O-acetyltransferase
MTAPVTGSHRPTGSSPRVAPSCPHGSLRQLSADFRRDVARHVQATDHRQSVRRAGWVETLSAVLTPHLMAVAIHRVSHLLHARGWHGLARLAWWLNHLLHKTSLSPASCIGGGLFLPHPLGIRFHGRARNDLTLFSYALCTPDGDRTDDDLEGSPLLGDGVTIGVHGAVLGDVCLGPGARVAPRTTVRGDVPAGGTAISRALRVKLRSEARTP